MKIPTFLIKLVKFWTDPRQVGTLYTVRPYTFCPILVGGVYKSRRSGMTMFRLNPPAELHSDQGTGEYWLVDGSHEEPYRITLMKRDKDYVLGGFDRQPEKLGALAGVKPESFIIRSSVEMSSEGQKGWYILIPCDPEIS